MRYVQRVVRQDGRVDLYLRKKGLPSVRLAAADGSPELQAEVTGLIAALAPDTSQPGTLKEAARTYEASVDYLQRAESTRYEYRLILREFEATLGPLAIGRFDPKFVMQLRDAWAKRGHRAANIRLQVLRNVLARSVISGQLARCPVQAVPNVQRPSSLPEPHLLWPDEVVELVITTALEEKLFGAARAVALARHTGARRGDLIRLPRSARGVGRIRYVSGKRKVPVDIAEEPALTAWLARIPAVQPPSARAGRKLAKGALAPIPATLVFNVANQPYTEDGLGQAIAGVVGRLHAAGRVGSTAFNLHGLRHTRGVELALGDCTDAQGAAMLGHSSPNSFAQYRRQADRLRLAQAGEAAMARARERRANGGGTGSGTPV